MPYYIPIIAGSTRRDRQSIKVARFVLARLQQRKSVQTELLDLLEYNFPIMEERLHRRDDPPPRLQEYADKIARADSLIIVTPEYNNGYPGVLKNALDYLLPEYERKPIGIVTVSAGGFGGINFTRETQAQHTQQMIGETQAREAVREFAVGHVVA